MSLKAVVVAASLAVIGSFGPASAFTLDFGTLGPDYTNFGTDTPFKVAAPGNEQITFTAAGSQFELYTQGSTLANNQFANGTHVLSAGLTNSPVTLSFSKPLEELSFSASSLRYGTYTATFSLFDGTTLLDTVVISSDLESSGSGPLPSIDLSGFGATRQRITSAVIAIDQPSNFFGGAVLLGPVSYTLSAVPLPASAPMFGAALLALGAIGYGMRRKQGASAA